jgi:hypothetical protein
MILVVILVVVSRSMFCRVRAHCPLGIALPVAE